MAKRDRGSPWKPSNFEKAFGAVLLAGLPLALLVPDSFDTKIYSLVAVFFGALGAGVGAALLLRPPEESYEDRFAAPELEVPVVPDAGKWSVELLKRLDWRRFGDICAAYFAAGGFEVRDMRFAADGDIDLQLHAQGSEKPSIAAHCKSWNVYSIGLNNVRELRGVMGDAVEEGVFVTSGTFTEEAKEFARKNRIRLVDGAELLDELDAKLGAERSAALLAQVTEGEFLSPTCPACGVKMVWRASELDRRKAWGCVNYPACEQTFFGGGRLVSM